MKKNSKLKIAIITSGGDAPGINACIRAIVKTALYNKLNIVGIQHGFEGLISGNFIEIDENMVRNIISLGGTILKSSRSEKFKTKAGRRLAYEKIIKEKIDFIIIIGGDGSFQGVKEFIKEFDVKFIGIPKTIDNDISNTDVCIGYDTALNTAMQAIDKIQDTAGSHERIFIVEVMGRNSGFIALGAGFANGADSLLIPEIKNDIISLEHILQRKKVENDSFIIVVAEGDENGGAINLLESLKKILPEENIGICKLGHIQRGGSPSAADRILASKLGFISVEAILNGKMNCMIGVQNEVISYPPFDKICKKYVSINSELTRMISALTYSI